MARRETSYSEELEHKLASLAATSGCYLFKDRDGAIVYVGKAKSLRSRVRSYFTDAPSDERYFVPMLRNLVTDLETVVTDSEKEAAVLENELIKKHQPRFNVKLRDDKDFLCLRLDPASEWPRLETVRRPSADGARYFGPYHSATSARRTLHLVNKHFKLRTCTDAELRSRKRPCLQYQIKRCPAPCVYQVNAEHYAQQVHAVELFLDARHDELTGELGERMRQAATDFEYELAAMYRDQLRAVESIQERQRVVQVGRVNQDVVGLYREGTAVELVIMLVRKGHVTDSQSFSLASSELPDAELVAGFVNQYYSADDGMVVLPDELLLPVMPDAAQGLGEWLSERADKRVRILAPKQGPRRGLLQLANDNAAHAFREKRRASAEMQSRLEEVQRKLRLPSLPRVIECIDISHLGGGDAIGAIVCFSAGEPDKKRYRTFRVRTTQIGDDYAAIYEVLARRFRRGRAARESSEAREAAGTPEAAVEWELPDLLLIDGGRGQLNVALAAAHDLGLHDLCIASLAKERETATGDKVVDRVYLPGQKNGIPLKSTSAGLYLLARARDEAHRFANYGRTRTGKKRRLHSALEDIPGIGPMGRTALLRELGSLDAIRGASDAQILAVPGITRRHLVALRKVIPEPAAADA
jgi:excinuclease ABC subunit C